MTDEYEIEQAINTAIHAFNNLKYLEKSGASEETINTAWAELGKSLGSAPLLDFMEAMFRKLGIEEKQ